MYLAYQQYLSYIGSEDTIYPSSVFYSVSRQFGSSTVEKVDVCTDVYFLNWFFCLIIFSLMKVSYCFNSYYKYMLHLSSNNTLLIWCFVYYYCLFVVPYCFSVSHLILVHWGLISMYLVLIGNDTKSELLWILYKFKVIILKKICHI